MYLCELNLLCCFYHLSLTYSWNGRSSVATYSSDWSNCKILWAEAWTGCEDYPAKWDCWSLCHLSICCISILINNGIFTFYHSVLIWNWNYVLSFWSWCSYYLDLSPIVVLQLGPWRQQSILKLVWKQYRVFLVIVPSAISFGTTLYNTCL